MVIFWAVVPLVQNDGVLVVSGWGIGEIDVDAGCGIEVFGCIIGGESGGMGVDTGSIEVALSSCVTGGVKEPTTTTAV